MEKYTITLQDIQDNENLRQARAMPGDEITNNELNRVFSSSDDAINKGYKITQQDIDENKNLQEGEAQVGDRIVNNELVRSYKDDAFEQLVYKYDKGIGGVQAATDVLEAQIPLRFGIDFGLKDGFEFYGPERFYGKGFMEANTDERREMIERFRERQLLTDYGHFFEVDPDSTAGAIGSVAGVVVDPSSLLPVSGSLLPVIAKSVGLSSSYSVLEDLATTGEIDVEKAAMYGAFGGTGGGVGYGIGKVAGSAINKAKDKKIFKNANSTIDDVEKKISEDTAEGFYPSEVIDRLESVHGFNQSQISNYVSLTGRTLKFPRSKTDANKVIENQIVNDPVPGKLKSTSLNNWFHIMGTQLKKADEALYGKMEKHYFDVMTTTVETIKKVKPFIDDLRSLNIEPNVKTAIARHLSNANFSKAEKLMPESMKANFNVVKSVLDDLYDDSQSAGIFFQKLDDYFPRTVKDIKKLRDELGVKEVSRLQKMENEYAKKIGLNSAKDLSLDERSYITNQFLRGYGMAKGPVPRFAKERKIDKLTDDFMQKHYEDPADSLNLYIRNAVNKIGKYKFFGRNAIKNENGIFNINDSIGKTIQEERIAGRLSAFDEDEVVDIIQTLMVNAEKPTSKTLGSVRDIGYMGTIGNPISAITQLADLAASHYFQGFRNTMVSIVRHLIPEKTPFIGKKQLTIEDIGIDNIAQELAEGNVKRTTKVLNSVLDISLFRKADRLGKEVHINAAFLKASKQVKTPKGEAAFRKQYEELYSSLPGKKPGTTIIDDLIEDLKLDKFTPDTKFHTFNELSRTQPITMLQMPKAYANNPDLRLLYMLKSFTLKVYDVIRQEAYDEIAKGNVLKGTKNLTTLIALYGSYNLTTRTIKDLVKGREVNPDMLPENVMQELLGVLGINKYSQEKGFKEGEVFRSTLETFIPAINIPEAVLVKTPQELAKLSNQELGTEMTMILNPFANEMEKMNLLMQEPDSAKVLKELPIVGSLYYQWFGGGAEKYNERQAIESLYK
tara:strand:+ start:164 stop:3193 length:3030 start_codon:yes stop_codon:yes gene_type:complete